MKKTVIYTVLLLLVLSLAACNNRITTSLGIDTDSPPPNTSSIKIPVMNPPLLLPEYPIIDGSSSTVTMHAAIQAYLTGAYFVELHSQTYAALERLIPGSNNSADVVLAVKYYDDTLEDARNRGADLVITPIAKEGFVFLVKSDNPIDSLTQQQLRDIYSEKITNWKEVGGKDERIQLFTRNLDSGSRTAMEDFMGNVPIAEGAALPVWSMGLMIDTIGYVPESIGYNIYSWSMEQLARDGNVKLLAVDGIRPSNNTLADGSYPLTIYTYSYYNNGNEKGKALTDWLLTAEGQRVIASAGYVGLYGDLPSASELSNPIDFNKDGAEAEMIASEYYPNHQTFGLDKSVSYYLERVTNKSQTESFADGKGKDVTVLYLLHYTETYYGGIPIYENRYTNFVVLTKERGGKFEIINEGAMASFTPSTM